MKAPKEMRVLMVKTYRNGASNTRYRVLHIKKCKSKQDLGFPYSLEDSSLLLRSNSQPGLMMFWFILSQEPLSLMNRRFVPSSCVCIMILRRIDNVHHDTFNCSPQVGLVDMTPSAGLTAHRSGSAPAPSAPKSAQNTTCHVPHSTVRHGNLYFVHSTAST